MQVNKKRADALKNKERKQEIYHLVHAAFRASGWHTADNFVQKGYAQFNVGPFECTFRTDYSAMVTATIYINGKAISVGQSGGHGIDVMYHWTKAIPTDADMMQLRLYS